MMFANGILLIGGALIIMPKYKPEVALQLIEKYKCTSTFMPPTLIKMLLSLPESIRKKYDLSSMKSLITGAAPCPRSVKEEIYKWLGEVLYEFYGSTELGMNTVLLPKDQLTRPGSCGKPFDPSQMRILHPKTFKDVGEGEEGLIYFKRSERVIDEYYNAPDKNSEFFNAVEGWCSVGDVGKLDKDGYLYICDRAIDMIISGGSNIYPAEIEDCIHKHPSVLDCAVFGVPDDLWGEKVHAAVVLKEGASCSSKELIDFCRKNIADYKIPREVSFHKSESFPRDNAGKILKRKLREPHWKNRNSKL